MSFTDDETETHDSFGGPHSPPYQIYLSFVN